MLRQHRLIWLIFATAVLSARPASATKTLPADLGELVAEARAIVHGRVIDTNVIETGDHRIYTLVTLEVDDYLKGHLGRVVTFRSLGGELGGYRTVFVGAPSFEVGDEVILLLGTRGPSIPHVLGFSQGVFRVRKEGDGEKTVTPPPLIARSASATRLVRGDRSRRALNIEAFKTEIRNLLAQPAQRGQGGVR